MTTIASKPLPEANKSENPKTPKDPGVVASFLWIGALVLFQFIGIFVAIVTATILTGEVQNPAEMGATTLIFGILVGSLLLIALRAKYMIRHLAPVWNGTLPNAFSKRNILMTVGLVIGVTIFTAIYQTVFIGDKQMQPEVQIFLNAMEGGIPGAIMVFLVGALAAPVLEEVLFRGQLQGAVQEKLKRHGNRAPYMAIFVAAATFSIIHFQPLAVPPLFVAGCVFGWLRWKTGSLAMPIIAHVVMNFMSLTILMITGEV